MDSHWVSGSSGVGVPSSSSSGGSSRNHSGEGTLLAVDSLDLVFVALGAVLSFMAIAFVLRSAIAFKGLRVCASNLAIVYCAAVALLQVLSAIATIAYTAVMGHMIPPGPFCTANGAIRQATFAMHSAIGLMYLSMVFMLNLGNRRARRYTFAMLFFNTLIFIGLAVWSGVTGKGYVPRRTRLYCWMEDDKHTFDSAFVQRFVLVYVWGILPILVGFIALVYILRKTFHMRESHPDAFILLRNRTLYAVVQALYWAYYMFDKYYPDYDDDDNKQAEIWGHRLGMFWTSLTPAVTMVIFSFSERIFRRWRIRRHGPSEEREEQLIEKNEKLRKNGYCRYTEDGDEFTNEMAMEEERKDPFVHRQLSEVLDDMGAGHPSSSLQESTNLLIRPYMDNKNAV